MAASVVHRALARAMCRLVGERAGGGADQLTGLANRDALSRHLEGAIGARRRRRLSVLYVDLDDFKLVNDTLGHAAGDELLRRVARAMGELVGPNDLLARQGGDEFVLVARDVDDSEQLARSLREAITEPSTLRGLEISIGVSIGIAVFPDDGLDPDALLEAADAAMYEAKRTGRNEIRRGRPGPARDRDQDRAALEFTRTLPEAIRRDELTLHWQPLVDVDDLSIVGLEALVRWEHPERGLLLPGAFLPFAHQTGMIAAVDEWVAGAVSRQRHLWHAEGLDPYVGFNLAPQFARQPGALERMLARLTAGGLDLDHLTIELTESEALREDQCLVSFVRGLAAAGVTVSLDDFGRAYSSLSRLRDVPARWVKLDRAFLDGVPEDPNATNVLVAVIDLLRALRLEYIIEGVEHEAQRRFLCEQGVRVAQGFLLGRPVPAAELHDRLRASPVSLLRARFPPAAA
jgi:diguanylate cyclase (GGDEF)-like protein